MIIFLAAIIFVLFLIIGYIFISNYNSKAQHDKNMQKLQSNIISLHYNQKQLKDKVIISNEYGNNFRKDMKALGIELVELQKFLIELITVKKNK